MENLWPKFTHFLNVESCGDGRFSMEAPGSRLELGWDGLENSLEINWPGDVRREGGGYGEGVEMERQGQTKLKTFRHRSFQHLKSA